MGQVIRRGRAHGLDPERTAYGASLHCPVCRAADPESDQMVLLRLDEFARIFDGQCHRCHATEIAVERALRADPADAARRKLAPNGLGTPYELDLGSALDEVESYVRRYMVMSEHQLAAVALWVAHTYPIDRLWVTPYLHITSGDYGSGKTRLLHDVLGSTVRAPLFAVDISPADLYRTIHATRPTALIDEVDALFGEKRQSDKAEAIRATLGAGYRRRGAEVRRWDAAARASDVFNTFCPKALAGVGDLPRSLATRSIRIRLKKRLASEPVAEWSDIEDASDREAQPIRDWLAELTPVLAAAVSAQRPRMPPGVRDRDADIWAPLLAIADAAGRDWPARARAAAVALLADAAEADDSSGFRLLLDLRTVVGRAEAAKDITTADMLDRLFKLPDSPWRDWYGRELTPRKLAAMLKKYDCRPHDVRTPNGVLKGYSLAGLREAFDRYLREAYTQSGSDRRNKRDIRDLPQSSTEMIVADMSLVADPNATGRDSSHIDDKPETSTVDPMSRMSRVDRRPEGADDLDARLVAILNQRTANGLMTEADALEVRNRSDGLRPAELRVIVEDMEDGS